MQGLFPDYWNESVWLRANSAPTVNYQVADENMLDDCFRCVGVSLHIVLIYCTAQGVRTGDPRTHPSARALLPCSLSPALKQKIRKIRAVTVRDCNQKRIVSEYENLFLT